MFRVFCACLMRFEGVASIRERRFVRSSLGGAAIAGKLVFSLPPSLADSGQRESRGIFAKDIGIPHLLFAFF